MSKLVEGAEASQEATRSERPRPVGRPSVQVERRKQIVEAAVQVILEHGIAGATRSRIGEKAGMKPSAVHHFVGTQDAVLRAAIEHISRRLQASLTDPEDATGDPRVDFSSVVDLMFGRAIDQPDVNQLVDELVAHSYRNRATAEVLASFYGNAVDALAEQIREAWPGVAVGEARAGSAELIALAHSAGTFRHLGLDELAASAHSRARKIAEVGPAPPRPD